MSVDVTLYLCQPGLTLTNLLSFWSRGPEDYDAFVLGMKADNIKILMILGGCGPDCTNPLYPSVATPSGRAAFANFAVASASHFERLYPGGIVFELQVVHKQFRHYL